MTRFARNFFWFTFGVSLMLLWASCQSASAQGTFVPPVYDCKFHSLQEIQFGHDGLNGAVVWYCDMPKMISRQIYCGNVSNLPNNVLVQSLDVIAIKLTTRGTRECTPEEHAVADRLFYESGPRVTVASNGTANDRPIYAATATNTRGAIIPGKRAVVGTYCGWNRLQDDTGKATNYFAVEGGYTLCKVTGPLSKP